MASRWQSLNASVKYNWKQLFNGLRCLISIWCKVSLKVLPVDFFRNSILAGYITMMSIVVMNFIDWLYQHSLTSF